MKKQFLGGDIFGSQLPCYQRPAPTNFKLMHLHTLEKLLPKGEKKSEINAWLTAHCAR